MALMTKEEYLESLRRMKKRNAPNRGYACRDPVLLLSFLRTLLSGVHHKSLHEACVA